MSNFDERSGIVAVLTSWGRWWQTIDEIYIEINVPEGTAGKNIKCTFTPTNIKVYVKEEAIIDGDFYDKIHADEAVWTLVDKKLVQICLPKSNATAAGCWKSLLVDAFEADPWTFDQMEQKMTLQRFQYENPGMDFSGASITGNYHGGGPTLPG